MMRADGMKRMFKRGIGLGLLLMVLLPGFGRAQKVRVSFLTGGCITFAYGSEQDYVLGENDFPVTPAHSSFHLGSALGVPLSEKLLLELDGRFIFSSPVTLEDPSDEDTVRIDTSNHLMVGVNLIYRVSGSRFRPYILVGAGFDKVFAEDMTATSEYGFDIIFEAPSGGESLDPLINIGAGGMFALSQRLALRMDARYALIADKTNKPSSLSFSLGFATWF